MGSSARTRIAAALVLCLAAGAVAGLLLFQHHGEPFATATVNEACGDGQTSGCEDVARSAWSSFAGFPLAGYGLAFYLSLALLLALSLLTGDAARDAVARAVTAALALGLLVDLGLLGVQAFAIHAYCTLCIVTYVLGAAALFALLPAWRPPVAAPAGAPSEPVTGEGEAAPAAPPAPPAPAPLESPLSRPDARLALAGWALGTLAIGGFVFAANAALSARAAQRQATLLGAPAPAAATPAPDATATAPAAEESPAAAAAAASPSPAAALPAVDDAGAWRERAQKLQETLDDPRKLEAYFAEKAQREYDTAAPVMIDLANAPAKGPESAPVKVVEYSDFLCPFCRNLGLALSQFVPQAGGRVVVYFKNYPLDSECNPKVSRTLHDGACELALGAICAHRQGKFDAYHDRVFSTELRDPKPADVARLAGEAGLNAAALEGCMDDPRTRATLDADIAEANRLGVNSTPTVYINGKKLPRINDFVAVVDREARKKGFPPLAQQ